MKWISTDIKNQWSQENSANTIEIAENFNTKLQLCGEEQEILGFGGCFNELGMIALNTLEQSDKTALLDEFFKEENCNFNFCRFPIGASDYGRIWYSHNETDGDFEMEHFSIERDYKYLLPYIKEAAARNKKIKFFASPWSPPTWLKNPPVYNFGTLINEPKYQKAYAKYLAKFVMAYEKEGIHIDQLHVQNEPCANQKFPSCVWTGAQMRDFIADYLIDAFKEYNLTTEIWLGTINGPTDDRPLTTRYNDFAGTVLDNEKCYEAVKGVSYQWAGKFAVQSTHEAYPEKQLIQSENECGDGTNTWEYAKYIFELTNHYFRNGVSAYVYWNFALLPKGESSWGWQQNSMITIEDKKVVYNPEFYVMKHFSHFVKRGAKVIKLKGLWSANAVAFKNPNGETIVVAMNSFDTPKIIPINGKGYELKANSFNTFVF